MKMITKVYFIVHETKIRKLLNHYIAVSQRYQWGFLTRLQMLRFFEFG